MYNTRNERMDYFKGLLMLGVILGHAISALKPNISQSISIHVFIRTYDMPFFILISGLFLSKSIDKYIPWKNLLNKFSSIMFPTIIWGIIIGIFKSIISFLLNKQPISIINVLYGTITGNWFLWSALACSCIMIVICAIFKKNYTRLLISVLISVVFLFIPNDMYNLAFMFPFYAVGFFMDWLLSKLNNKYLSSLKLICVGVFIVLLCFWNPKYNIWNAGSYLLGGNALYTAFATLYRFFIGITGCITMSFVFDILFRIKNPLVQKINNQIISAGKNTMILYIFQGFIIEYLLVYAVNAIIKMLNFNPFTFNINFLGYVLAPIIAFVCMVFLNRIIIWMRKTPILGKYIFGFKIINAKKSIDINNERI